jgi:hypothetical protein
LSHFVDAATVLAKIPKRDELEVYMEQKNAEHHNIDESERFLNDNWNERKQLVNQEFEVRENTLGLILKGASHLVIDEARPEEAKCRRALTKNTEEYEALVDGWVAAMPSKALETSG